MAYCGFAFLNAGTIAGKARLSDAAANTFNFGWAAFALPAAALTPGATSIAISATTSHTHTVLLIESPPSGDA